MGEMTRETHQDRITIIGENRSIDSTTVSMKTVTKKTKIKQNQSPGKKRKYPPVIINVLNTRYEVISEVAKELGWKVSEDESD